MKIALARKVYRIMEQIDVIKANIEFYGHCKEAEKHIKELKKELKELQEAL